MGKWDNAGLVESAVWDMRLADLPRDENRTIIHRQFNGDPPFDESEAEENNIQINRNDLEGVNLLSQAREQWFNAMLPSGDYFTIDLDKGPTYRRKEWSQEITNSVNRVLREHLPYVEAQRARGGNAVLHGIGPSSHNSRTQVVGQPLPVGSLMIPSETELGFENLEYFAVFRELTPSQLYCQTHGFRVDPGWNMPLVHAQLEYVGNKLQKEPNATAYQYMPGRIEELIKQDLGFWGSDAVPTIDVWDFYFREKADGCGWYRRTILDWGLDANASRSWKNANGKIPPKRDFKHPEGEDNKFLYTSGKRRYANSLAEILQCQFADTSCYFPAKYHSQRSLGWMLWGICDLQNRLHCKFNENLFLQLMWFFRVASDSDLKRLKQADFMHFGIIPPGVNFVPANERYSPPWEIVLGGFNRNRQLMQESSSGWNQNFEKGDSGKEQSATEVMAKVNAVSARVSGMLNLAYTYQEFDDRETCRRLCIRNSANPLAQKFQALVLEKDVPLEALDVNNWIITRNRVMGGGNDMLQMAIVNGIQKIRPNLSPEAQRRADHLYLIALTKRADVAEDLAPLKGQRAITNSMHDAQLATDRILRGLPFTDKPDMVYEDYVKVWLADLTLLVQQRQQSGGMASQQDIQGFSSLAQQIGKFLKLMGQSKETRERVKQYSDQLSKQMNLVKAFAQRLMQQMKDQARQRGQGGANGKDLVEMQMDRARGQLKIQQASQSHAQRTAQRQIAFELEQQRADRETAAEIRRENAKATHELARSTIRAFQE